ncbi:MAG: hypothetical protein ACKO37_09105 [Vampirovibrionales bacterium]
MNALFQPFTAGMTPHRSGPSGVANAHFMPVSSHELTGVSPVENPFKQVVLPQRRATEKDSSSAYGTQGFTPKAYLRETQQRAGLPDTLHNPYLSQTLQPSVSLASQTLPKSTAQPMPLVAPSSLWDKLNVTLMQFLGVKLPASPYATSSRVLTSVQEAPKLSAVMSSQVSSTTQGSIASSGTGFTNTPLAKPMFLGYREGKSLYGASKLFVLC